MHGLFVCLFPGENFTFPDFIEIAEKYYAWELLYVINIVYYYY